MEECDPHHLPVAKAILPDGRDYVESSVVSPRPRFLGEADFIDRASDDSFPASDAPTWATGRARWREATLVTPDTPDR